MKHIQYSFLLGLVMLASCTGPRILTDVMKVYPLPVPGDSVTVFEVGDPIPNSAEAIGRVSVLDQGMTATSRCKYDEVLRIACEETGKAGGNGLALTNHLEPSFWGSSCHQITGTMLHLTDYVVDSLGSNPWQEAMEVNSEKWKKERKQYMAPSNTLEANVGYGWITSALYSVTGEKYKGKGGMEWGIAYDHVFRSGFGFGAQYAGCRVTLPDGDMNLSYIAPSFVLRERNKHWILKCAVGAGAFIFSQGGYRVTRLGINATLGIEYMVSKSVGIGVSCNAINVSLPKQEGVDLGEEEHSGISRINLLGGARFYF